MSDQRVDQMAHEHAASALNEKNTATAFQTQLHEWIREASQGDTDAYGRLYEYYMPMIYRFVRYRARSEEDAQDLTEEIFLKSWRSMESFNPKKASFKTWLFTIARRTVIDFYRTRKDTTELEENHSVTQKSNHPDEHIDQQIAMQNVIDAVRQLPRQQADVIALRYFSQLETKEIAPLIKKSEGATRVLLHRALKELRRLMNVSL